MYVLIVTQVFIRPVDQTWGICIQYSYSSVFYYGTFFEYSSVFSIYKKL